MANAALELNEQGLRAAIAPDVVSSRQLLRLREHGCLPRRRPTKGGGRGRPPVWVYPADAVDQLRAVLALRREGVRTFWELRIWLWIAGFDVRLPRKELLTSLPRPISLDTSQVHEARKLLSSNRGALGPAGVLLDRRSEWDWPALASEIAEFAEGGQIRTGEESELGRLIGDTDATIPGLTEVRSALESASSAELARAREQLAWLIALGRQARVLHEMSGLGRTADRAVRSQLGRGVELALAAAPLLGGKLVHDPAALALMLGSLVAYQRRGFFFDLSAVEDESLTQIAAAIVAYRAEIPGAAELLSREALRMSALDGIAADAGDEAAKVRLAARMDGLRDFADGHRPEIDAFLARHPEAVFDDEEVVPVETRAN